MMPLGRVFVALSSAQLPRGERTASPAVPTCPRNRRRPVERGCASTGPPAGSGRRRNEVIVPGRCPWGKESLPVESWLRSDGASEIIVRGAHGEGGCVANEHLRKLDSAAWREGERLVQR